MSAAHRALRTAPVAKALAVARVDVDGLVAVARPPGPVVDVPHALRLHLRAHGGCMHASRPAHKGCSVSASSLGAELPEQSLWPCRLCLRDAYVHVMLVSVYVLPRSSCAIQAGSNQADLRPLHR